VRVRAGAAGPSCSRLGLTLATPAVEEAQVDRAPRPEGHTDRGEGGQTGNDDGTAPR